MAGDEFELYHLRVEVVATDRPMVCNHPAGDYFELSGENLTLPPGQSFAIYPLAALLPLLPAKQRPTAANDWMTTDADVACPDPHCGGRFRITRVRRRIFRHGDVTVVPLPAEAAVERRSRRSAGKRAAATGTRAKKAAAARSRTKPR